MLEEDSNTDDITDRFEEAHIQEQPLDDSKKEQLQRVLEEYREVRNKEPGLTSLIEFSIDTGEADPIHQHPYNTPVTLKTSVDREIDWLLDRKFIRPSFSPWASPMVTVKKVDGSAQLCVDFRKINGLTRQTSFYMPRVEEVLEGVGRSNYISKLDLSKGYYQVQLAKEAIPKTAFTSHHLLHAQGGGGSGGSWNIKLHQQAGPLKGVLPGPACQTSNTQDGIHQSPGGVRVHSDSLRGEKRSCMLPGAHAAGHGGAESMGHGVLG